MNRRELAALKAKVNAMPKCPTCGGFAIPSTAHSTNGAFVCKDHGRFVPKKENSK